MPQNKYYRFVPIGTLEEMTRFEMLCDEKHLNRAELILILRAIQLNPDLAPEFFSKEVEELF